MNSSLSLRRRYALDPMRARLELQSRKRTPPDDATDDFAIAAVLARILAQHFDGESLRLRVAGIHSQQIARENGRFVAASAGAHFEENVLVVPLVLRDEERSQLQFLCLDPALHAQGLF